jgi:tRNA threonylcarbamoyl adenosine modification protein (Sua5/YciO/YrdC/YwlC family)
MDLLPMVIYNIHQQNPQKRFLDSAAKILRDENGIAVYPTDTVYGMGALVTNPKAVDKIGKILNKNKELLFSFICSDFTQVAKYVHLSNGNFRLMKRYLPGPFTFILEATNLVPKKINPKRKTVGVRIPDCTVTLKLVELLGEPLANTSINLPEDKRGDPEIIRPAILNEVDVMLDAGVMEDTIGSTIIDLTGEKPVVIREGKGIWKE